MVFRLFAPAAALLSLVVLTSPAYAADVDVPDVQHSLSITISPIHLIFPILEATGEYRLNDKVGLAGVLGLGRISDSGSTYGVFELGAQARYYVVGNFVHGMQLGAELMYVAVASDSQRTVNGQGLSAGPFVGYKIAANGGFTFEGQLGATYNTVEANSGSSRASGSGWGALLNLNVGWSF
jgi:hypothetical protein